MSRTSGSGSGIPFHRAEAVLALGERCACHSGEPPTRHGARARTARRKLWEVSPRHHCTILGAAFDSRELRQIFRKAGATDWESASEYELHSSAVHLAGKRNPFSVEADRRIDMRYRAGATAFRDARDGPELIDAWLAWLQRGEPVEAYWALITHRACDAQTEDLVHRHMHMLGHELFATRRALHRQIARLQDRVLGLEDKRESARKRQLRLAAELVRQREAASDVSRALLAANEERGRLAALIEDLRTDREVGALRAEKDALGVRLGEALDELARTRKLLRDAERRALRAEALAYRVACDATHVATVSPELAAAADRRSTSGSIEPLSVLCIGGRRNLVTFYRDVVQTAGSEFLYHDGGTEDHLSRLPALLSRAESVVCFAADCSHGAMHAAKRYCKRFGKPCAFLPGSGVQALASAIGAKSRV